MEGSYPSAEVQSVYSTDPIELLEIKLFDHLIVCIYKMYYTSYI